MKMTIEEQLETYADLLERQEMLQKQKQELLDQVVIPKKIQDQLDAIENEFQPMIDAVANHAEGLKIEIQTAVLALEQTARGNRYMAVWNKGRETWDGKKLDGYAMDHPEILQAKKIGEPTVTFRKVK